MKHETLKNKEEGFSLIEILVAMGVFVVVAGILLNLFFTTLKIQRRIFASRELQDNARFVLELLSKEIRIGIRTLSFFTVNFDGSLSFSYPRPELAQVTYLLEDKKVTRIPGGALTSPDVEVETLNFFLTGSDSNDGLQPQVTIILEMRDKDHLLPSLKVRTTISARKLDLP